VLVAQHIEFWLRIQQDGNTAVGIQFVTTKGTDIHDGIYGRRNTVLGAGELVRVCFLLRVKVGIAVWMHMCSWVLDTVHIEYLWGGI
jgi:hypothetical protein